MIRNLHARFWAKVDVCEHGHDCNDCCWLWTAHTSGHMGYGAIYVGVIKGKKVVKAAHIVSWRLHHDLQPVPEGMCVLHTCDVPPCVNPHHLFTGTNLENVDDKIRKGRDWWRPKGSLHGQAKLTEANVLKIRALFASGQFTQKQLADRFDITATKINHILIRQSWIHVQDDYQPAIVLLIHDRNNRLTDQDVRDIRTAFATGTVTQTALAAHYGFTSRHIWDIIKGVHRAEAGGPISTQNANVGVGNVHAKMTPEHVIQIRQCYAEGYSQRQLAGAYNCSQRTITMIVNRLTWQHVG